MLKFDPTKSRDFWLRGNLKHVIEREPFPVKGSPPGIGHISRRAYAEMRISELIDGYLYGFANELTATVEKHIAWMESEPEPDRAVYTGAGMTVEFWREALFSWRLVLGVSRWLGRGDKAFGDMTSAAATDWQVVELVEGEFAPDVREARRDQMSLHLATVLAADAPLFGLKIFEAAGMKLPMGPATSPVRFGYWACRQLLEGGTRDEAFVARGKAMLTANLIPIFLGGGSAIEAAIWLKAIFFDSGVAQTAEETIARGYDCMPGISRPDFIPA